MRLLLVAIGVTAVAFAVTAPNSSLGKRRSADAADLPTHTPAIETQSAGFNPAPQSQSKPQSQSGSATDPQIIELQTALDAAVEQLTVTEAELAARTEALEAAQAQIEQTQAQLTQAEAELAKTHLQAVSARDQVRDSQTELTQSEAELAKTHLKLIEASAEPAPASAAPEALRADDTVEDAGPA
ncbi:MAG: hypothetical protein ACFB2Z_06535, partial [Maricaulaceae bacterium]